MKLTLEGNDYGSLPEGKVLEAEITKCEIQEKSWTDRRTGEPAKMLTFEFRILDEDYAGRRHWEDLFPSFYTSEKCRLYLWTLKILGRDELPEGFTLDTGAFVGTKVPIILRTRTYDKKDGSKGSSLDAEILSQVEAASLRRAETEPTEQPVASEVTSFATTSSAQDDDLVEPF